MKRAFKQVDVFTDTALEGNPLAVVLDGSGLDTAAMQRFTDWTNLSEATFLSAPAHAQADYVVRTFCPGRELPFAGHPTLGSCHAWLQAGGRPKGELIVQECGVGLVRIRRNGERLAFAAPPRIKSGPLDEADVQRIARGLGIARADIVAHAWCQNGPPWRGVLLRSAEQVLACTPDSAVLSGWEVGVVGPQAAGSDTQFEVRAFFTGNHGIAEDPVTGSLNAALAQWLIGDGLAPPSYVAAQGTAMGRAGRVVVQQDGPDIWVGGHSVTVIDGSVVL
jgi:PhzF family phenazine biosynthesis protein